MRKHYFNIFYCTVWILLLLLKHGRSMSAGYFFLFGIEAKPVPSIEPEYSRFFVWQMHHGVWGIIGVAGFSALLLFSVVRLVQNRVLSRNVPS